MSPSSTASHIAAGMCWILNGVVLKIMDEKWEGRLPVPKAPDTTTPSLIMN